MCPNSKFTTDLVTFTEEIFDGKLHFLCSDIAFHTGDLDFINLMNRLLHVTILAICWLGSNYMKLNQYRCNFYCKVVSMKWCRKILGKLKLKIKIKCFYIEISINSK